MQTIRLGISTCPNDTFAFHALMNRQVDCRGIDFQVELLDIQQLNDRLFQGEFDVAKASFHAAILLAERYQVLQCGSALGFGVGPLLLAANSETKPHDDSQLTLSPGQHTTAALLFRLFYPAARREGRAKTALTRVEHVVFSEIMPMLQQHQADFGVCIHEGRFTWQDQGLGLVEDLGARWEAETNGPLPLGGIVAAHELDAQITADVQAAIRESILFARANPEAALPTMRQHAQEFDDTVLMKHVDLYVNDWTVDLGPVGAAVLDELSSRAQSIGILASQALTIFGVQ